LYPDFQLTVAKLTPRPQRKAVGAEAHASHVVVDMNETSDADGDRAEYIWPEASNAGIANPGANEIRDGEAPSQGSARLRDWGW